MDRSADYLELARQLRASPGNVDRAQMYASLASAEKLDTFLDLTDARLSEIRPALDSVAADTEEQLRLLRADINGLGNWLGDVVQEMRDLLASIFEQLASEPEAPVPPTAASPPPPPPPPRPGAVAQAGALPQNFIDRFGYLERTVAAVAERAGAIDASGTALAERLQGIDDALVRLDARSTAIDEAVGELSQRSGRIESQLEDLAEGLIEVEDRMARRLAEAVAEIARLQGG